MKIYENGGRRYKNVPSFLYCGGNYRLYRLDTQNGDKFVVPNDHQCSYGRITNYLYYFLLTQNYKKQSLVQKITTLGIITLVYSMRSLEQEAQHRPSVAQEDYC